MTRVLFVCIQNAGRSQMAQSFAEDAGLDARSAGSAPGPHVHPEVADAMQELGIDIRDRTPHKLTEADAEWADIVVTMGCGDACPFIPGKRYLDWELPDPHGLGLDGVRSVRDDIRRRVAALAESLAPPR
jgi:arsenate reductase